MSWDQLVESNGASFDTDDEDFYYYFLLHHGPSHAFVKRFARRPGIEDAEVATSLRDATEESLPRRMHAASDRAFLLALCTWPHLANILLSIAVKSERVELLEQFIRKAPRIGRAVVRRVIRVTKSSLSVADSQDNAVSYSRRSSVKKSPFDGLVQCAEQNDPLIREFVVQNNPSPLARHRAAAVHARIDSNFDGLAWAPQVVAPPWWKSWIERGPCGGLSRALMLATVLKAEKASVEDANLPWHEGFASLLETSHPLVEDFYVAARRIFGDSAPRKRARNFEELPDLNLAAAGIKMQRLIRSDNGALEEFCAVGLPLASIRPLVQRCPQIAKALPFLLQTIFEKRGCTPEEWERITGEEPDRQHATFIFSLAAAILIEWPISGLHPFRWAHPIEAAHALIALSSDASLRDLNLRDMVDMLKERYE
eukprot:GEMP01062920.1.p1 GENE.GEMP01062920.1~~GEMP01062920.1.p1  ORF type:complete len:426 (+),score=87.89 GEMP01062920.1:59-1336(+)